MSGQDVGFFDVGTDCPDMVIENGDLKADNGLQTSALISVFSDRRVTLEELPAGDTDQRGWWADLIAESKGDLIGSRHWILDRVKASEGSAVEMESILKEAFEWMLDDGVASNVIVSAEKISTDRVEGVAASMV